MKGIATENGDIRPSRVTESNILELNISFDMLRLLTCGVERINGGFAVDKNEELRCGGSTPAENYGVGGDGSNGCGGDNNREKDTVLNGYVSKTPQSGDQDTRI